MQPPPVIKWACVYFNPFSKKLKAKFPASSNNAIEDSETHIRTKEAPLPQEPASEKSIP